jgi:hypothetical protein
MLMALVVMMTLPQHFSFTSRRRMKRVKTIQAARKDSRIKNEKSIYLSSSFHKFLLAEKCGVEKQDFSASSCEMNKEFGMEKRLRFLSIISSEEISQTKGLSQTQKSIFAFM